ncbi:hypothetical protein [Pseudodesulfovibrio sp.]|uniref:hypothetical protein n=1 Tax=unclassified Pseudodesulfovibrio TaxID=2661612 RepID=UPI003B00BAF7
MAASAGGNAARNNSAVAVMETAGALIALAEAAPIVATAAIVLCLAGLVASEEFNEMLKRGTTSLTAFIKGLYQITSPYVS